MVYNLRILAFFVRFKNYGIGLGFTVVLNFYQSAVFADMHTHVQVKHLNIWKNESSTACLTIDGNDL